MKCIIEFQAFRVIWLKDDYRINCIEIDYSDTVLAKEVILTVPNRYNLTYNILCSFGTKYT